jgi:hypothetical protein
MQAQAAEFSANAEPNLLLSREQNLKTVCFGSFILNLKSEAEGSSRPYSSSDVIYRAAIWPRIAS